MIRGVVLGGCGLIRGKGLWWVWPDKRGGLRWVWPDKRERPLVPDKRGGLRWGWPDKRGGL